MTPPVPIAAPPTIRRPTSSTVPLISESSHGSGPGGYLDGTPPGRPIPGRAPTVQQPCPHCRLTLTPFLHNLHSRCWNLATWAHLLPALATSGTTSSSSHTSPHFISAVVRGSSPPLLTIVTNLSGASHGDHPSIQCAPVALVLLAPNRLLPLYVVVGPRGWLSVFVVAAPGSPGQAQHSSVPAGTGPQPVSLFLHWPTVRLFPFCLLPSLMPPAKLRILRSPPWALPRQPHRPFLAISLPPTLTQQSFNLSPLTFSPYLPLPAAHVTCEFHFLAVCLHFCRTCQALQPSLPQNSFSPSPTVIRRPGPPAPSPLSDPPPPPAACSQPALPAAGPALASRSPSSLDGPICPI